MRPSHALTFVLACLTVSACSNGDILGINSHPSPPPSMKPTATPSGASPTPTASGSVTTARVTGKVVDFDSDGPLAGVAISVTPMSGTAYEQVATTDSDGTFAFSVQPGSYVIAVGSNSSSDDTRATEHDVITVVAGANAVKPIEPSPVPDYTLSPSQTSGNFRLAALSSAEQDCFQGMNTGRAAVPLPLVVEDEEQLEFERATVAEEVAQNTDEPSPMFNNGYASFDTPTGENGASTDYDLSPCSSYSDSYTFGSGASSNGFALNSSVTWYAGAYGTATSGPYEAQGWQIDPSEAGSSTADARHRQFHLVRRLR